MEQRKPLLWKALVMGIFIVTLACDNTDNPVVDDGQVNESLVSGSWRVTYYFSDQDETGDFNGYSFTFNDNGTATATKNSSPVNGFWSTEKSSNGTVELTLNFGLSSPLDELQEDWKILESSDVRIKLEHVSNGGTGKKETLTLEKN